MEKATTGQSRGGVDEKMALEEFKRDLEEDHAMRQEVNLWKNPR